MDFKIFVYGQRIKINDFQTFILVWDSQDSCAFITQNIVLPGSFGFTLSLIHI